MNRKEVFSEGEVYHLFNRGVEKRSIFINDQDYLRFLHSIAEFNDTESAENIFYKKEHVGSYEVKPRKLVKQNSLVELLAFTLLPNHYHLLLRQSCDGGISEFMQKLGTGYTMYFNKKYTRVGSLFQGTFKSKLVASEEYELYIPHYVHLNVLDVIQPGWKESQLVLSDALLEQLANYRWSSLGDYLGKNRYSSLLAKKTIKELFPTGKAYANSMKEVLNDLDDLDFVLRESYEV